ncbi:hypothetical protein F3F27_16830 [Bacteroides ovatus]|jgi:hypothetical protein|uniref:Uncharacterized protein n=7 Tax=Bacteroidales TaxID=171549 RepID=A0A412E191_BACSE|nr:MULTISPECIES: hypothetical protein [Bacteroides]KAA3789757.1 hypothetical protein F3F97_24540 [Bacteroides ovatus]RGR30650.1 hypothetical protein DWY53_22705 [Phocaeicola vulgatus]KAA3803478.1 hypothetical protein F3F51_16530 [Bacteroides ovatus]KAA3808853.1 hypothetical protein F3F64_05105 [Bacteroides ovatus]KAA3812425.1 hypothetical protein F3F87_17405 [Bacteroides ovatus]
MKGFYITYGIFTEDIETFVKDIEIELGIKLIKDEFAENQEVYYLDKSQKNKISCFSIFYGNSLGYYLNKSQKIHPFFLISCNIILNENDKIEYVQKLQNTLKSKKYVRELNFDTDEW